MHENQYVHQARLASDYNSMKQITGNVISWRGTPEADPANRVFPERYTITYNILAPTIRGDSRHHVIEIDCSSPNYPRQAPAARITTPVVRHPHFYDDGNICLGGFPLEESVAELCVRLARFLQYDPDVINMRSAASSASMEWYRSNRNRLPMDRSELPRLGEVPGFKLKKRQSPPVQEQVSGGITVKRRSSS
ncbi:hypothetical protein KSF_038800 [Reticulibacter mediterranei]|uniref:UBC core domain-containing protein n=1 Tax=Reticulibacter mediterranei TaxID=2778369 RepID=A0A8J3N1C4_9CHLR|nr:hypothetical protein [Reticulibacter mediterranei]GHO93832.1 hypothetical protein KSF_038800 [Reticulibacter mediterranei]